MVQISMISFYHLGSGIIKGFNEYIKNITKIVHDGNKENEYPITLIFNEYNI